MDNLDFNTNLPPEIAAEALAIKRRQRLAEAMYQQSAQSPQGRMVGRFYVPPSPMEGIAQMVKAYAAQKMMGDSDEGYANLGKKYQTGQAEALANYMKTKGGDPGRAPMLDPQEVEQQADQGTPAPPNVGAVAGDPKAAIMQAMMSPYLKNNPLIQMDAKQLQPTVLGRSMVIPATGQTVATDTTYQAEQEAARTARADEAQRNREARMDVLKEQIAARESAGQQSADLRRELAQIADQTRRDIAAQSAAVRRDVSVASHANAPVTAVTLQDPNDPNGTIVIDGRSGKTFGKGPKLTEAGKLENTRQFNMQGIGATIQQAEQLLDQNPTNSGIGAMVDKGAALFGATPKGATEAAQLEAVGGALVSKMPRMEGPQSDKDVMLYKEMAGKVGDRSQPVAARKAALDSVKNLWAKYERLNPDAFADRRGSDEPPPGAVRRK